MEEAVNAKQKRKWSKITNDDIERLIDIPYSYYLGVPLFTILALLLFAFLLGAVSSYLPLKAFHHAPIVEELRDE